MDHNFNRSLLKYFHESLIVRSINKLIKNIGLKDIGLFVALVVLFNTLAMVFMGKEIDVFSIFARMAFFFLAAFLILRKK